MLISRLVVGLSSASDPLIDSNHWEAIHTEGGITGGLQGLVTDKETGDPILAVKVFYGAYYDETDAEGYYEIPDIPIGAYTFTYSVAGYKIAERSVTIREDEFITLDVELTPGEGPEPKFPWQWLGLGSGALLALIIVGQKKSKGQK